MNASNNSLNASYGTVRPNMESESIFELQKLLNDERSRASQHKLNYQKIKTELANLQEKSNQLEEELVSCNEQKKWENDENTRKIQQLNRRLKEAQNEIEELKVNQISEKRIEMIRLRIEDEFENVYQERFSNLRNECETLHSEMQNVRQENMFLKSEVEHQIQEHTRMLEEIKLIHESEVKTLKAEKSQLLTESMKIPQESGNFKELSQENGILRNQIKSLSNELKESMTKYEQQRSLLDQETRLKNKQVSELTMNIKRMEIQENSLKKQLEDTQRDIQTRQNELNTANQRAVNLERTNKALQSHIDELVQKAKIDLSQLKLESTKQKGDIERQKDLQSSRIEELEYQLQLAGTKCGQLERKLQERDAEFARREAGIKEAEWTKLQQAESAKLELSSQINELETQLREERTSVSSRIEKLENKVEEAEKKERQATKEEETAKLKLEGLTSEIKKMKFSLNEVQNRNLQVEAELDECYNRLAVSEFSKQEKHQYNSKIEKLEKELKETICSQENISKEKEQQWKDDRQRLQNRIQELEQELAKSMEKSRVVQEELRRKNKKHGSYFTKQKQKLQIVSAKMEQLSVENDLLKQNVPAEEYQKLRKELKDIRRKHEEYRTIIMAEDGQDVTDTGGRRRSGSNNRNKESIERSLDALKQRLDWLDEKQQRQMPEMINLNEQNFKDKDTYSEKEQSYGPEGDK